MTKLYRVIAEQDTYGEYLTEDSRGRTVLEIKGTGSVRAFNSCEIEEVLPYTINVRFLWGGNENKEYGFLSKDGEVSMGDILLLKGYINPAMVVSVDTKNPRANVRVSGRKVATQRIGE